MRQISPSSPSLNDCFDLPLATNARQRAPALARQPTPSPSAGNAGIAADRTESPAPPRCATTRALAPRPTTRAPAGQLELRRVRRWRPQQHDLRAPPQPMAV